VRPCCPKIVFLDSWKYLRRGKKRNGNEKEGKGNLSARGN